MQFPAAVLEAAERLTQPSNFIITFRVERPGRGLGLEQALEIARDLAEGERVHVSAQDSVSIVRSTLKAMGADTRRLVVTYY